MDKIRLWARESSKDEIAEEMRKYKEKLEVEMENKLDAQKKGVWEQTGYTEKEIWGYNG